MVPRETATFVFSKHQDSRENKINQFPEGPYIKCFVLYLDLPLNNHIAKTNKQRRRAGNNCAIVFDQGHVTKNQPITVLILLSESLAI